MRFRTRGRQLLLLPRVSVLHAQVDVSSDHTEEIYTEIYRGPVRDRRNILASLRRKLPEALAEMYE